MVRLGLLDDEVELVEAHQMYLAHIDERLDELVIVECEVDEVEVLICQLVLVLELELLDDDTVDGLMIDVTQIIMVVDDEVVEEVTPEP